MRMLGLVRWRREKSAKPSYTCLQVKTNLLEESEKLNIACIEELDKLATNLSKLRRLMV
jgi:hypothetical protein